MFNSSDDYDLYCDIFLEMSTGKIVDKYYGHGSYDTFPKDEIMPYNKAIELGVVTSEYIKNAIYNELFEPYYTEGKLSNIYFVANCSKNVCIPCFVNGGRKFRGSGIFVGITSKYNYYSEELNIIKSSVTTFYTFTPCCFLQVSSKR